MPEITAYICDDCGRRFFNKGWHAEACGSPNWREVGGVEGSVGQSADAESAHGAIGDAGQEVGLTASRQYESRDGSGPEDTQPTEGKRASSHGS